MKKLIERIKEWFRKSEKPTAVTIPCYIDYNPHVEVMMDNNLHIKMRNVVDAVKNCRIVSWDLWEMGNLSSPQSAIRDFNGNENVSIANNRIKYCDNKDTFMSEMMRLSLAHDVVDIKLVKSMDKTHGIIMVLFCVNGEGKTNIDADLIDLLASTSNGEYV